ncbi:MAG: nitroreductase family protein, partial [Anaerococcus vaginalis]|nr:nitroreductase family protein [Anaerococcus vaginalis]
MNFIELVKNRYSCKNFSDKKVEKEKLDIILEAGRLAPTAKNNQIQRIYVAKSNDALIKIDEITPCRYKAPLVLLVAFDESEAFVYPGGKYNTGVEDATIVASHMILAAASLGVDSCWVNLFDPDKAREKFSLPKNEKIIAMIDLGYANDGVKP